MMTFLRKFPWLRLIPLLLVVTALAARMLNADVLFVDEYWSIRNSGGAFYGPLSPVDIWQTMSQVDPGGMGILYQWLLAAWFALAGTSELTLRLFSLFAGLLCLAWVYRMGREMFGEKTGLYAAVILGCGAFYLDYLHEGRAYTLLALFAGITVWTYWRIMTAEREPGAVWYVVLAAGIAALAYTHYVALAMGAAIGVYHLAGAGQQFSRSAGQREKYNAGTQRHQDAAEILRQDEWRTGHPLESSVPGPQPAAPATLNLELGTRNVWWRWWKVVLALAVGGALFLPWLDITLAIIRRGAGETTRQETAMTALTVVEMLIHTFSSASGALLALLLTFALRLRNRSSALIWCSLLVILGLILGVNAFIPFMVHPRYLLVIFPALALLTGIGVAQLTRKGVPAWLLLTIWAGAGLYHSLKPEFIHDVFGQIYRAPKAGVDAALSILRERARPDDFVIFHIAEPGFEPFQFFVLDYLMHGIPGRYDQFQKLNNSFAKSDNAYFQDVLAAFQEAPFIYTLVIPEVPMTNLGAVTQYALDGFYVNCGALLNRPDMLMTLYARPVQTPPLATFSAAEAIGLYVLQGPLQSGDSVDIVLGWSVGSVPPLYSVGLHVYDAAGRFVTQADGGLPERRPFACQNIPVSVANLPEGAYTLYALVYNWQTGERLPVTGAGGNAAGDRVEIATFRVETGH